jgi:TM2 domain-containing membrane protein YozV
MAFNVENFALQVLAMAAWILAAAGVLTAGEYIVRKLDDGKQALITSYLLWIALGWAGAHRIYNDRIRSGLALLALSTCAMLMSLVINAGRLVFRIPFLGDVSIPMPPLDIPFIPFFGSPLSIPFPLIPIVAWWLVDAFLIPGWVRDRPIEVPAPQGQG